MYLITYIVTYLIIIIIIINTYIFKFTSGIDFLNNNFTRRNQQFFRYIGIIRFLNRYLYHFKINAIYYLLLTKRIVCYYILYLTYVIHIIAEYQSNNKLSVINTYTHINIFFIQFNIHV